MRTGISLHVTASERERLLGIIDDRNSPQKHVWRARIVLLTADGHGTTEIMCRAGVVKTAVWRWQERFMQAGVDGLLRDRTRPPRIPPLGVEVVGRVVQLTLSDPPGETTHWTAPAMARASGVSVSSVQRIWRSHGLQPHRMRRFKLSNDPRFAEKLRDVVGLYVDPLAHAMVLSIDEKSQIQALDRTQPGLPLRHHDPRLHPQWHHHPLRRAGRGRGQGHRPLNAAPSASGLRLSLDIGQAGKLGSSVRRTALDDGQADAVRGGVQGEGGAGCAAG